MKTRWQIAQFFEAWWWRNYLRKRPVSEYLEWKRKYWKTLLIQEKIDVLPTDEILDAGCGPAGIFMMFPKNKVLAIDPLLAFYRINIPHFKEENFSNVNFEKIKLEQLAKQNCFDIIFCLNAINHVKYIDKSVVNLGNALKRKGALYLSIDAHNYNFLKHVFQLIPGDILHPHQLNLKEYEMLLKNNGLKISKSSLLKKGFIFNYYLLKAVKE
jgi:2-polyprenyl-6-hydroxyphenyl methylase/3-demethylubiquinone-9 3-methyltransferase